MKVSPEARRLAKYKEKKKEISVAMLQFDVTFCSPILCAPSDTLNICMNDFGLEKINFDKMTSMRT